ncbi:hypothetical protein QWZ10_19995 [Paracoccus cavernae]|uniref:Uncharacterized protein n=1 Tax=Paracoccus cavernae TaxID=1571207 RepID=A0ABT8DAA0_9RHOB|nr:hypothetical protein [Paracoccus cavernae]MDN3713451.1 hypothetical protein [Paracoccus cavernae]
MFSAYLASHQQRTDKLMASCDDKIHAAILHAITLVDEIARITIEDHPYRADALSNLRLTLQSATAEAFPAKA